MLAGMQVLMDNELRSGFKQRSSMVAIDRGMIAGGLE
jgi:hypothetical protein